MYVGYSLFVIRYNLNLYLFILNIFIRYKKSSNILVNSLYFCFI